MRPTRWLGPAILTLGIAVLSFAVGRGEASVYLVVIVPVVAANGPLALLGILLVFAGLFLTFLLWPTVPMEARSEEPVAGGGSTEGPPPPRRWGGVVFLGPIPLLFGSDPRITRTMLWVGVALFFALLALTLVVLFA